MQVQTFHLFGSTKVHFLIVRALLFDFNATGVKAQPLTECYLSSQTGSVNDQLVNSAVHVT